MTHPLRRLTNSLPRPTNTFFSSGVAASPSSSPATTPSFEPSQTTAGGTTFAQAEEFSGALGFLMGEGFVAKQVGFREKTLEGWEATNEDFKKWCEC